jgi:hypothetical protein
MLVVDNACAVEMSEDEEAGRNKQQQQLCLTKGQSNMWAPWAGH